MVKRIVVFCLTALLIFMFNISAFAIDNSKLDLERKGSVSVTMRDSMTQKEVPGGQLTIYKVADVEVEKGNPFYVYTEEFKSCQWSLEDLENSNLLSGLEAYVKDKNFNSATSVIGEDGVCKFEELDLGLYLVIQTEKAEVYYAINSFLVSVPVISGDEFVYDVDATSKAETLTATPTATPTTPVKTTPKPPSLPQTGQLNWPIPILIIVGLIVFATGWVFTFSQRRKKDNEA